MYHWDAVVISIMKVASNNKTVLHIISHKNCANALDGLVSVSRTLCTMNSQINLKKELARHGKQGIVCGVFQDTILEELR